MDSALQEIHVQECVMILALNCDMTAKHNWHPACLTTDLRHCACAHPNGGESCEITKKYGKCCRNFARFVFGLRQRVARSARAIGCQPYSAYLQYLEQSRTSRTAELGYSI